MKILTEAGKAANVAARWKRRYYDTEYDRWGTTVTGSAETVYNALVALGPAPTKEDITAIIGNSSWTNLPSCNECNTDGHTVIIEIGQEPDYETATAWVCLACFTKINNELKVLGLVD